MKFNFSDRVNNTRKEILRPKLLMNIVRCDYLFPACFLSFSFLTTWANDTIPISLSERKLRNGDTLSFDYSGYFERNINSPFTIHLLIEHIQSKRSWKMRYPIIKGKGGGDLVLSDRLPQGYYALNFLFDNRFFELNGNIRDYNPRKKNKLVLIDMVSSLGMTTMEVQPSYDGMFTLPPTLFQDTCVLLFGYDKNKSADIYVDIKTPLDSFFIPFHSYTTYIQVGESEAADTVAYKFDKHQLDSIMVLPEVVVTRVLKRNVELFDQEFSSTMFKNGFATVIDGLSSDELSGYPGILQIIQSRIPGLSIRKQSERLDSLPAYMVKWRGVNVSFYLDEFLIPLENILINPADIAMIKAIPPPANIRPLDGGGAVAIYTKRGKYETANSRRKSIFKVIGYTPTISMLQ